MQHHQHTGLYYMAPGPVHVCSRDFAVSETAQTGEKLQPRTALLSRLFILSTREMGRVG